MFWETLDFTKKSNQTKTKMSGVKVSHVYFDNSYPDFPAPGYLFVGVDPGMNFGITLISERVIEVMWGKLSRVGEFMGRQSQNLAESLGYDYELEYYYDKDKIHVYVEGAAYRSQYGQVELEQIRFGFVQGFSKFAHLDNIKYIPPSTARKKAFGSGKLSGKDLFVNINNNGADSIGVALAAVSDYVGLA